MTEQRPSVGRIVHYVSYGTPGGEYGKECRAAVVTEVRHDGPSLRGPVLSLAVLNPTGMFFNQDVTQHEAPEDDRQEPGGGGLNHPGGTWHWPERA